MNNGKHRVLSQRGYCTATQPAGVTVASPCPQQPPSAGYAFSRVQTRACANPAASGAGRCQGLRPHHRHGPKCVWAYCSSSRCLRNPSPGHPAGCHPVPPAALMGDQLFCSSAWPSAPLQRRSAPYRSRRRLAVRPAPLHHCAACTFNTPQNQRCQHGYRSWDRRFCVRDSPASVAITQHRQYHGTGFSPPMLRWQRWCRWGVGVARRRKVANTATRAPH